MITQEQIIIAHKEALQKEHAELRARGEDTMKLAEAINALFELMEK